MISTPDALLPEVVLFEQRVFRDDRGSFRELYNSRTHSAAGLDASFVQDNMSISARNVLRGIHIQHPDSQGKLVTVLSGSVFDVAVDLRVGSPTFARWTGYELTGESGHQLWIPPGFGHGFLTLSESAVFVYKCTEFYSPSSEVSVLWNDEDIGVEWPVAEPVLSPKDATASSLAALPASRLPRYTSFAVEHVP